VKDFQWGVFPFPQMPGEPGKVRNGGGADRALCIPTGVPADRKAVAAKFLEYVSRPEIAALYLAPEIPIYASVASVQGADIPVSATLREQVFPNNIKFLDWIWPTAVTRAVASAVAGVVAGQLTPEKAAASVQSAYDQLVAAGEWPPKKN
jgi:raffinose/stachyose/melibiose transport system substrate-binding protein